ncbi:MAG: D-hexose-6-phosphate mutarotase [Campylobacterota bacterium]|nr:D-hexose-6-phosphate mutarotase [Campylobacterota bacterium]
MVTRKQLKNGFEYLDISNESSTAKIALQGGHIFHYARVNEAPILWLSEISDFEAGKAIRGGIPICWPWFGMSENPELPQHGFARTSMWEFISTSEPDARSSEITLRLEHSKASLELWPFRFELLLHVRVSDTLSLELKTINRDDKAFKITQALHSYFQVSHISNVSVKGLDAKPYFDALTQKTSQQIGDVTFDQEVDRVYQDVHQPLILRDRERGIVIETQGSASAIVWNPWIDKCARMSAIQDDAYQRMLCIESANAREDAHLLQAQFSHSLIATIRTIS